MFSLTREVLMPAAHALLMIGALVFVPSAQAKESLSDEKMATDAAAPLVTEAIPGADVAPAEGLREAGEVDDAAADARDVPQCRRFERIGKFTVRHCQ